MKCPKCKHALTYVKDSRKIRGTIDRIRRRRVCTACGYRYSTYEVPAPNNIRKPDKEIMKKVTNLAVINIFKGKHKFTVPEMVALKEITLFGYGLIELYTKGKV